jgi:hypothetical protein
LIRRRDQAPAPDERTPYPAWHDGVYAIMTDLLQIAGALLVLGGFTGAQLGWLGARSVTYLILNAAGAALLAALALHDRSWGFLLLEGVWTVVSLISLAGVLRGRPAPRPVLDGQHRDQEPDQ